MGAFKDLTGNKYGRLKVIAKTNERKGNGSVVWNCICDCGNEKHISSNELQSKGLRSCGKCKRVDYFITAEIDEIRKGTKSYFTIDVEDIDIVKPYKWFLSSGYVTAEINGKATRIHQLLLGFPKTSIDHIDRNPLNNRRNNLRACTQQGNTANTGLFSHNTTGYKGVCWDKQRQKYMSKIKILGKTIFIGRFKTKEEAALAYNERAKKEFGTFARLNNVGNTYGYNTIMEK